MARARPVDFDLAREARSAGFTPRVSDVAGLLELLGSEDKAQERAVEAALARVGAAAVPVAVQALPRGEPRTRAGIARLLGRLAPELDEAARGGVLDALVAQLDDSDARVRRHVATALGKLGDARAEPALCARFSTETGAPERRVVAEALGRVGGARAVRMLRAARDASEGLEREAIDGALLTLARVDARAAGGTIELTRSLPASTRIAWRCREGLEGLLAKETGGQVVRSGRVEAVRSSGKVSELLTARIALDVAVALEPVDVRDGDVAAAVAAALVSAASRAIFRAFGAPPYRYRIEWLRGGHRRAETRRVASLVAADWPELVNDPRAAPWEARVVESDGAARVDLVPHGAEDLRFAYRRAEVPAASHPTIAASLAFLAGARENEIVWDPFVGSGLELCERAQLGPCDEIIGTDTDERAITAARVNLAAAGVREPQLVLADARTFTPKHRPTLVITNPPLGRRHAGGPELESLLYDVLDRAADVLAPGGRIVWISPYGARTAERAKRAGLTASERQPVDMDGFVAELQRFDSAPRAPRAPQVPPRSAQRRRA